MLRGEEGLQIPQIHMESQLAQIGITQTQGEQIIYQPKADLQIEQPKADVYMQSTPSKITIDQTKAWEEVNLMSPLRITKQQATDGIKLAHKGTARRARQGDQLMRIEEEGNPIVSLALQNGYPQMKSLGITFIPSPFSVEFNVQPPRLHIDVEVNPPLIQAETNVPYHRYERGKIDIYMEQEAQLNIKVDQQYTITV